MGYMEVVFAKCKLTGRIFAVCTGCGCAWFEPQHETWELGNLSNCAYDLNVYAPEGFVLATRDEMRQAGFEPLIVDVQDGEKWAKDFEWYCRQYCHAEGT
jgi:hypothetical protein